MNDESVTYLIHRSGKEPLKVTYTGVPPCLWCDEPVVEPSADGPLVCGRCDMGLWSDRMRTACERNRARNIATILRANGEEPDFHVIPREDDPYVSYLPGVLAKVEDLPEEDERVVSLDRVRALKSFEGDESVAYVELLWGAHSFAVHAAIRDLEAMRQGKESADKPLRDPATTFEAQILVDRIRWTANYLARAWGLEESVRPGDWQGDEREPPEEET